MTFQYDKSGKLVCASCGSHTFDVIIEQRISNVSKDGDDPIANRTIESESVISVLCSRCGAHVND